MSHFSTYRRYATLLTAGVALALLAGCQQEPTPGPHVTLSRISFYEPMIRQRTYWPTEAWKTKSIAEVGINKAKLDELVQYAFKRTGNDKDRKGPRTDGFVLIKNGYLVYEKYARGFTKDKPHLVWSVSKSFVNALYGIAIKQNKCKLDDKAAQYYKPLQTTKHHKAITLRQLLNMTPGLSWKEGYEASPINSSVLAMLYGVGRGDMAKFTAQQPMRYHPGTHFYYSSGTTNLAVGVLRAIIKKDMEKFIWGELFDKIGMKQVTWQRDGAGNVVGSSYLYAPPRQLAKFGYLYLNDGIWAGKRLFPKGWVKFTTTTPKADQKGRYGAHFWLNVGRMGKGIERRFPEAPKDFFMAGGHWGQRIIAIPSLDLVAVLTADNRDRGFNLRTFVKMLVAAVSSRQLQAKSSQPPSRSQTAPAAPTDARPLAQPAAQPAGKPKTQNAIQPR